MNRISIKGILKAKHLPFKEPNGRTSVRLEVSAKRTNNSPESENINIYTYGANADEAAICLQVGSTVSLDGHIETYSWRNSSGRLFSDTRIVADDVLLVTKAIYSDYNASTTPDPEYHPGFEFDNITRKYIEMPTSPVENVPY